MNSKILYYFMLGLIAVICLGLVGSVLLGNQLLKQESAKLTLAKAESKAVDDQKLSLVQAKKDVEEFSELNEIAKSVIPQDKDQAKTVREINTIAQRSRINLSQISFESSTLGQKVPAVATAPATEADGSSVTPATPPPPPITQVKPVTGINGVYSLQITISSSEDPVPYYKFLEFLENLENNRRTAHVTSISISPAEAGSDVTFSLTLNAYLRPNP